MSFGLCLVERRSHRDTDHLRLLIANERKDCLELVASGVVAFGQEVIAREIDVQDVGPTSKTLAPSGASSRPTVPAREAVVAVNTGTAGSDPAG